MAEDIKLSVDDANELETLLRMLSRACMDPNDLERLRSEGLAEAADAFADVLNSKLLDRLDNEELSL